MMTYGLLGLNRPFRSMGLMPFPDIPGAGGASPWRGLPGGGFEIPPIEPPLPPMPPIPPGGFVPPIPPIPPDFPDIPPVPSPPAEEPPAPEPPEPVVEVVEVPWRYRTVYPTYGVAPVIPQPATVVVTDDSSNILPWALGGFAALALIAIIS